MTARRRAAPTPPLPPLHGPARTAPAPVSGLSAGARVRILHGLSQGKVGRVVGPWHTFAPGIPTYELELDGEFGTRVIRADFLEAIA